MMKPVVSIIIPTWNNPEYLNPCIDSIIATGVLTGLAELVIVNNGVQPIKDYVKGIDNIRILEPGRNLGWENGLQYGLDHTDSEYVCFQNDDTLIPKATQSFYAQLLWPFQNTNIGAVGPATTIASGWHSVFNKNAPRWMIEVPYLIFFTVMMRRADLIAAGGIDTSCPGGDDFDLSIRLRKMGKSLVINPDAFIIHHAFKTGERVRGGREKPGGWNSKEMIERTNKWLIQKHGFKTFMETMRGFDYQGSTPPDTEGDLVATFVRGKDVIELGCGGTKTVPQAIGVDLTPKGENCSNLSSVKSVADIVADVSKPLPIEPRSIDTVIARHILEHMIDPLEALRNWNLVLKLEGRLIIAVPNHDLRNTIPLNPEHVHGFTPSSLRSLVEAAGFKGVTCADPMNGISFVTCFENVANPLGEAPEQKSPAEVEKEPALA